MGKESTRRAFLTTVGAAGVVSLAGCSSLPGGGGGNEPADPGGTNNSTSNTTTTTTNGGGGNGGNNAPGQSVVDFSNVQDWQPAAGKLSTTTDDVFQGDQSVVLEPKGENVAKITKTFFSDSGGESALDLSKHDLSLAAKIKKPNLKLQDSRMKIAVNVIAPAESAMVTAIRQFPRELDQWVRFDLGYTDKNGNPKLGNVTKIEIQVGPRQDGKKFKVLVDDLRKVPKANKGKVMLQFDDGFYTTYENAFPMLQERGWPGSAAIIPDAVNGENYVTDQQMREMSKAGWDIIGHYGKALSTINDEGQKQALQQVKQYLKVQGFKQGAKHFVLPNHRLNNAALKNIDEMFETAYLQGGSPNNAKAPSNPSFISRINGESIRGARRIIDMADEFNQLAVLYFHEIGDGDGWLPKADFQKILDHIEKKDVDVITPTQLINNK
ncbi:polysaccharide deacetylase family protein [Halocatena salina]|uniref:Polysaccharide deacetylase family protein n=1 Tax=Halocatena salina TaxID=2934340 RepID=A0A8U0A0M5_9EURY|nr:polysaccharide deacetylase family protein [Halocatena salina]UPM42701.1 polysaccharide deacetylase family protein [Halocatena salina]